MIKALYPGSFDPFHNGHVEIVERASLLFDSVVVAAMRNPQKADPLFSLEERQEMIVEAVRHIKNVEVVSLSTLVVDLAFSLGASVIVRGLRVVSDFEVELQMAQMNRKLSDIDTVFIPTSAEYSFLASKLLREVASFGGNVTAMVPKVESDALDAKFGR